MRSKAFLSLLHIVLFLVTIGPIHAKAQNRSGMGKKTRHAVAIITRYDVTEAYQKQFVKLLRDYTVFAGKNKHNIMAEVYAEQDSPAVLWVIERWTSGNAYRKIRQAISYKAVAAISKTALTKPASIISVADLEPLPVQEWRKAPGTGDEPITIMLFVDAKPGTEDNFKDVYHVAMPQFRSEPGVINYQLSQLKDDKTRFVTYEKFRNEAAFQYHLNFPPIQPVINYLNTSIKKQPFQIGLHRLKEIKLSEFIVTSK